MSPYLNIMFRKLLSKRTSSVGSRVDSVINGHLSIVMVQPAVDVFTAFLQDLLAQDNRSWRRIWEEIVVRDLSFRTDSCPAIVTKMKDASFDTKPSKIPRHGDADVPTRVVNVDQHRKF